MCKEIYQHVHTPVHVGDSSFMQFYSWHDSVSSELLHSSESCVHACTLHPWAFLKTSRKTGRTPGDGIPVFSYSVSLVGYQVMPCAAMLGVPLYPTLRITDVFPCVGYTVASPCFGLCFFSVCWTRTVSFSLFFCVCADTRLHVEAQGRCWVSPLWPSTLSS